MTTTTIKNIITIIVLMFISFGSSKAQEQHSRAIGLYIDSFTKYLLWPNEPKEELVVGVYGGAEVHTYLQSVYEGKKIKKVREMEIKLKKFTSVNETSSCDILFISKEKSSELEQINTLISGLPILVVTCIPGYKSSSAVNIDIENNYHLEICSQKIRDIGMKISSALTSIADEI